MSRFLYLIKNKVLLVYYKRKWNKLCRFCRKTKISDSSTFEGMSMIHYGTSFHGTLGFGSYIGQHSEISADIGRFTSIGGNVKVITGTHPYLAPFVSTSPCFVVQNAGGVQNGGSFSNKDVFKEYRFIDEKRRIGVKIGNDCWICDNALIVGGVTIGDGAVVLANAVVTKDVPPYAIIGGVPAKVIRFRYEPKLIDWLLKIQWWNNSKEWFQKHWELMLDIEKLKKFYCDNLGDQKRI